MINFSELDLDAKIYQAIKACGYTTPTPVQAKSIPEVLLGKDLAVSAQTGTGKTAAFVLPILHKLSQQPGTRKTRVLILTPTRELAAQITKAAGLYGKFLKFNIVSLVGGMPYHHQIKDLSRGADIIVATPGRLLDHIEQKRADLANVEMLVLDEADRMLDMGFIDDVQYIAKLTPAKRQTLLFSATLDNKLMSAVKHLLKNPVRIDLSNEKLAAPKIKQEMYKANNAQHKTRMLKHFLNDENIYKAIIFSATKVNADKLATQLREDGFAAAALHGDLRQNVRNRTLEQLRRGKIQFLVATDVAARGIDVVDITHVINYDLPRFCEDYVHRIGRTGRAGKTGVAISFVMPSETRLLKSIERYLGQRINVIGNVEIDQNAEKKNRNLVEENFHGRRESGEKRHHSRRESGEKREYGRKESGEKRHHGRKESGEKWEHSRRESSEKREYDRKENGEKRQHGRKENSEKWEHGRRESSEKREFGRKENGEKRQHGRKEKSEKWEHGRRENSEKREFGRKENGEKRQHGRESFNGRRESGDKREHGKNENGNREDSKRDNNFHAKKSGKKYFSDEKKNQPDWRKNKKKKFSKANNYSSRSSARDRA